LTYYITIRKIDTGEIYLKNQTYAELMGYYEQKKVQDLIEAYYIRDVDSKALGKGTLCGMVDSLGDGYSKFYTEEEFQYFDENSEGSCISEGMLIKIDGDTGYPIVKDVFADTPAFDAGISRGDYIFAVDGNSTQQMDLDVVLGRIRGIDGTSVKLTVLSGNAQSDIELVRKSPDIQLVFASMVNADVGYINIVEFSGNSVSEFDDAIKTMNKEGAKAIVIDLRGTLGGNISQTAKIVDKLLNSGTITYTKDKNGGGNVWNSDADQSWDKPVVLLVDGDTVGVAEVFAAAIQDRQRGEIIGTNTCGKAAVTSFFEIQSTGDVVKLVTTKYYSPNGMEIDGKGITPDEYATGTSDTEDTVLTRAAEILESLL
jgi:carboxyl-terminal processing protease